jgi:hypothetical protein
MRFYLRLLHSIAISLCVFTARGEDWPQFRGPGGRAVSETANPPIGFDASSNLLWKVAIPEGVSSPTVTGQRIFLTTLTAKKSETFPLAGKLDLFTAGTENTLTFDKTRQSRGGSGGPATHLFPFPFLGGKFVS